MRKDYKRKNSVISEINIAPFTDVILVLLVIFMITTPVLMQPGVRVNIPKAKILDSQESTSIEILISKKGCIYIGGKQINNLDAKDVLYRLLSTNPDKAVIIKCDKEARYDYLVQTMAKAKEAGATKFALAVDTAIRD